MKKRRSAAKDEELEIGFRAISVRAVPLYPSQPANSLRVGYVGLATNGKWRVEDMCLSRTSTTSCSNKCSAASAASASAATELAGKGRTAPYIKNDLHSFSD